MGRRKGKKPSFSRQPAVDATQPTLGGKPTSPRLVLMAGTAVVLLVALIFHWRALHANALAFDDVEYLVENPLVRNPGFDAAWRFLGEVLEPSTVHGYYQPLTMITLMVDYALGGRPNDLMAFHRTSLLLHLANTALVIVLLYQLFNRAWPACLIGLLFAVHPMTVETIDWVGERKTVLASFFALAALVSYVRYTRRSKGLWYAATMLLFILALMSKPTSTPLPVCMLLLDLWPLKRFGKRAVIEKLPLLMIALVSAYITYESQKRTAVVVHVGEDLSQPIVLTVMHNIVFYLQHMFFPNDLSSHYPFPYPMDMTHGRVIAGVVGTILLMVVLGVSLLWTRALAIGWLYWFVAIFPTLGVVGFTNVIMADKFAYLPSVGIMLPIMAGLTWWIERASVWTQPKRRLAVSVIVIALSIAAGVGTYRYHLLWRDTETLFRYMVAHSPGGAAPRIHLANELTAQADTTNDPADWREALKHATVAAQLAPAYEATHYNLGNIYMKTGRNNEAIAAFRRALKVDPEMPQAHNNLANVLFRAGRLVEAIEHYRLAIAAGLNNADIHYNLANALARIGQGDEAVVGYQRALELEPEHAPAHKNLAGIYLSREQLTEAVRHYHEALRLRSDWWDVAVFLVRLHALRPEPEIRDPQQALRLAKHACRITGNRNPAALAALAIAHGEAGQVDTAIQIAQQASRVAESAGQPDLAQQIMAEMERYRGND